MLVLCAKHTVLLTNGPGRAAMVVEVNRSCVLVSLQLVVHASKIRAGQTAGGWDPVEWQHGQGELN